MRGSGDMGAFLACCWGTRLQDPSDPYKSRSFLSNLKQRDFESQDFEVTCGPDCRLHIVDNLIAPVMTRRKGFKSNRDGMDGKAEEFIKAHLDMSLRDTMAGLEKAGIKRGRDWISRTRVRLKVSESE
jgi:hypothetical protein